MPVTTSSGLVTEVQQKVGAVDPPRQMKPSAPAQPNQRHPVWYNGVCRVQYLLERRVMLSLDDSVHTRRRNRMASAAIANPLFHSRHDVSRLYRADRYSKHFERAHIFR